MTTEAEKLEIVSELRIEIIKVQRKIMDVQGLLGMAKRQLNDKHSFLAEEIIIRAEELMSWIDEKTKRIERLTYENG